MIDLARIPLQERKAFERMVANGVSWKLRDKMWKAVQLAEKSSRLPLKSPSKEERSEQRKKVQILAGVARKVAEEVQVSPELLAPRVMLEELVHQHPDPVLLRGWRGETVGPALTEALNAL